MSTSSALHGLFTRTGLRQILGGLSIAKNMVIIFMADLIDCAAVVFHEHQWSVCMLHFLTQLVL